MHTVYSSIVQRELKSTVSPGAQLEDDQYNLLWNVYVG